MAFKITDDTSTTVLRNVARDPSRELDITFLINMSRLPEKIAGTIFYGGTGALFLPNVREVGIIVAPGAYMVEAPRLEKARRIRADKAFNVDLPELTGGHIMANCARSVLVPKFGSDPAPLRDCGISAPVATKLDAPHMKGSPQVYAPKAGWPIYLLGGEASRPAPASAALPGIGFG